MHTETKRTLAWLLLATAVAGTLDIVAAILVNLPRGLAPITVLQSVASGFLGREAFEGGMPTALLGLFTHYTLMAGMALVFLLVWQRWRFLQRHWVISGMATGIVIYAVMNLVVLPLSAIPFTPKHDVVSLARNISVHMACVGLPMAFLADRYGPRIRQQQ